MGTQRREVTIMLTIEGEQRGISTIAELRGAIDGLRTAIESEDIGTAKFKQLSGEIRQAETELGKLDDTQKGLSPDDLTRSYLEFGNAVFSGFALAGAAGVLFADQNEEVQRQIAKAQALLTIVLASRGVVEAVLNSRAARSILLGKIRIITTKALTVATRIFNAVLRANPIGIIITAVIALVVAFLTLGKRIRFIRLIFKAFNDSIAENIERIKLAIEVAKALLEIGKDVIGNLEDQIEAQSKTQDAIDDRYSFEIRAAQAAGKDTKRLEIEKLKATQDRIMEEIRLIVAKALLEKEIDDDTRERVAELRKELLKSVQDIKIVEITIEKEKEDALEEVRKKGAEERKKREDKEAEARKKAAEKEAAEEKARREKAIAEAVSDTEQLLDIEDQLRLERAKAIDDDRKSEKEQARIAFEEEILAIQGIGENATALRKAIKERERRELAEIDKKFDDEEDATRKEELEKEQALSDAKISLASQGAAFGLDILKRQAGDSEASQKKAFETNKRLSIAQGLIDTYLGVQRVFSAAAANPDSILFPAQPFIQAGFALVAGLKNVNQIRKQKFTGGSGGGGAPSVPGGFGASPAISPVSNTSTLLTPEGNVVLPEQAPLKTIVTEEDITKTQDRVGSLINKSTVE